MKSLRAKQLMTYNWIRSYMDENQFSQNNKLPSENVICRKLNISRDTVRDALACLETENLIYRVQGSGTYINKAALLALDSKTENKKIGLILQGQDPNANYGLISGIKSVFAISDIELRIFFTDNRFSSERNCLNTVVHQHFDGFIIDGVKASFINPNLDCYHRIFSKRVPVIFYNNYYKELKYPRVINNDFACAEELLKRLVRVGHKRIAGIFVSDNYQSIEKFRGYTAALYKYGGEFNDDDVKWCVSSEAYEASFLRDLTKFIKKNTQCTGIVCCNYMIMEMVLQILENLGKRVPEDYSVVCFDYSKDDWVQKGITCSVHPGYRMGVEVSSRLLQMIQLGKHYGSEFSYLFEPYIFEGGSVGPARRRK